MAVAIEMRFRCTRTFGAFGSRQRGINLPVNFALGTDRRIYILNRGFSVMSGSPRRPGVLGEPNEALFTRVSILQMDDDRVPNSFAPEGTDDGQLTWPTGIAIDSQGRVYISDEARHDIQVFDPDGNFISRWAGPGSDPGQLSWPSGLAIDNSGDILVADAGNDRIQRFGADGTPKSGWGRKGSGPGEMCRPWGITVAPDNSIYVADWGNDRVQRFGADGDHIETIRHAGIDGGGLRGPSSVAVDQLGNVYVADLGNNRVQVFDLGGDHVTTVEGDGMPSLAAAQVFFSQHSTLLEERKADEEWVIQQERSFRGPMAVRVDDTGLYVANAGRHRIERYEQENLNP